MSAVSLVQRRRAEIESKLQSLNDELSDWKAKTEIPPLRRHYRQVRRLASMLGGLLEPLEERLQHGSVKENEVLANSAAWENEILTAHTIWEVFRSKLALRQVELFRDYLAACDDFAFACYQPARDQFTDNPKEPPLVYLSATWSPFAMSRDGSFQNEIRAARGTAGYLAQPEFQQVLNKLPIPLLSIPWYQVSLLPCALILAHEVGHVVEWDFDLTRSIANAIENARIDHKAVWGEWASEVFADIYGCLSAGSAFAGALIDLLATSREAIQQEERESGKYPTRYLRVELCLTALEKIGQQAEAQRLRNEWAGTYGAMSKMNAYLPEVEKVVQAIVTGPYHGKALTAVVSPPAGNPSVVAQSALLKFPLPSGGTEPRAVFAAARWLQENETDQGKVQAACRYLRDQLVHATADVFRAAFTTDPKAIQEAEARLAKQDSADHDLGHSLRGQLKL